MFNNMTKLLSPNSTPIAYLDIFQKFDKHCFKKKYILLSVMYNSETTKCRSVAICKNTDTHKSKG